MQFTFDALVKLAVFTVVANTAAVVALPEPVGLEARQTECLATICNPSDANSCCAGASCTGVSLLGSGVGVCALTACDVICSTAAECCTDVPGTTFTCQLVPGQTIGVCVPQIL